MDKCTHLMSSDMPENVLMRYNTAGIYNEEIEEGGKSPMNRRNSGGPAPHPERIVFLEIPTANKSAFSWLPWYLVLLPSAVPECPYFIRLSFEIVDVLLPSSRELEQEEAAELINECLCSTEEMGEAVNGESDFRPRSWYPNLPSAPYSHPGWLRLQNPTANQDWTC